MPFTKFNIYTNLNTIMISVCTDYNIFFSNEISFLALAFFKKYMQLRGEDGQQETYYNMARAFHQIGLLPSAIHFYKLVLEEDPGELVTQHTNLLDLKKEAAFNLHLIYLQSENYLLARMYLENYITI